MIGSIGSRAYLHRAILVKGTIITGLILVNAFVAFVAGSGLLMRPKLMLLGLGVLLASVAIHRLEYGILGLFLTAAVVPLSLPTGTASRVPASMIIAALLIVIWLARMVVSKDFGLKPCETNLPLLGFVAASTFSLIWSNAFRPLDVIAWPTFPLVQLGGLAIIVLSAGSFLFVANVLRDFKWIERLWLLFIIMGAVAIILNLVRIMVIPLNIRGLFPMWVVSLAYGQVLFNHHLSRWQRLLLAILVAAWVYKIFFLGVTWISGWLPTIVAILALSFLKSKRLLLVLLLFLLAHGTLDYDFYYQRVWAYSLHEDAGRLALWQRNWEVTREHLLFGTGPAGYAVYYMTYFPKESMSSHSNYVDVLSQTGIIGSFFFLWFLASLLRIGLTTQRRLEEGNFVSGLGKSLVCGFLGVVVAMGLGDWFLPFVYNQGLAGFDHAIYSWMMLGVMVTLDDIERPRARLKTVCNYTRAIDK